ncbi:MarR family winged helix-turn-helix transcriptional regulator [Muricoccus aerilatus]|uniref:MarR family winged helix-turn-helix transcriptional regulator n=1 Tax=Muricoccus aerilatus TaxID=452982 RepID=UPI0006938458|nr:MarR family transcriptional regulator [Roseomonas aerilata]
MNGQARKPRPAPAQGSAPEAGFLAAIYARPGFKLRRAHQIALSVFAEECRSLEVTSTQYGILVAVSERPGLDQVGVAQALGLDRSTTGMVVGLLEGRGLLRRDRHATDGRRRVLSLTEEGARLLEALAPAAERARRRLLAPLSAEEARTLTALLDRLMDHHDALVRVPLMRPER